MTLREWWAERWPYVVFVWLTLAILALFVLATAAMLLSARHQKELYDRCLADGHKDYECYSMVHGGRR